MLYDFSNSSRESVNKTKMSATKSESRPCQLKLQNPFQLVHTSTPGHSSYYEDEKHRSGFQQGLDTLVMYIYFEFNSPRLPVDSKSLNRLRRKKTIL